ncbi:MBL fold metallo-hydrolase [Candidatus Bipolaricaulota bacterium]|nr:MBL fold metallo-hydrolase [Candidatus Bipolaricaulota bacterium]
MGYVKFLGTAGARFVVAKQLRYSAGTWIELDGTQILLDPGPGTLLRARRSRPPLEPEKLTAIVLTHKHLDHSTDVNIMLEAMAGGRGRRGILLAPWDALEGEDPVVLKYVRRYPQEIITLSEGGIHHVGNLELRAVKHRHGQVETYGVILSGEEGRLGFVVDTAYFPELGELYAGCDLLVLNVVRREVSPGIDHLSLPEAARVIAMAKPRLAVLTHFGMTMLRADPRSQAERLSRELGVKVLAAADGMTLPAAEWRKD